MENLIVYHNPKFRNRWLVLGLAFFALGIIGLFFTEGEFFGSNMGICIVYLIGGLYTYYKPYLRVKNNVLWVSSNPFRKTPLNEIQKIKQFLDETTIISKGKETLISTQNMSEEGKEKFLNYIEELKETVENSVENKEVLA
tara:strand:+ start:547 stop:969 length:423 start_codon:yes stop_codon:yes gene_type:complete